MAAWSSESGSTSSGRPDDTQVLIVGYQGDGSLGRHLGNGEKLVDPHHVHAYVIGEHGDSEILACRRPPSPG
jgi:malate/lactate dehydrogenase